MPVTNQTNVWQDLRFDFQEISTLMNRSWQENREQARDFSPELVASSFEYPGSNARIAPAWYDESRLGVFTCGFPRRISLGGRELRVALNTFLSVAPELKGRGLGSAIWTELFRRERSAGFDGAVHYCTKDAPTNRMGMAAAREIGASGQITFPLTYLMRFLLPKQPPANPFDPPAPFLVEEFLQAAQEPIGRVPLARLWTREEAEWQCVRRLGAFYSRFHAAGRSGFLTGYILPLADETHTNCLFIDDILWGPLDARERAEFLERYLSDAAARGAKIAIVPLLGYADIEPFHAARFRQSRHAVSAYVTLWNGETPPQMTSMYMDVF